MRRSARVIRKSEFSVRSGRLTDQAESAVYDTDSSKAVVGRWEVKRANGRAWS